LYFLAKSKGKKKINHWDGMSHHICDMSMLKEGFNLCDFGAFAKITNLS